MSLNTVQEIESAISGLTQAELDELWMWVDNFQYPLDSRMQSDLASGRLDHAIAFALGDEQSDLVPSHQR